jgi:predicted ArsR family transcriptional regulator
MKKKWTKTQKLILKAMYQEHRPMSMMEISKLAGVSWVTVKKHIPKLMVKNVVILYKQGKRKYYKFNYQEVGV